MTLHAMARQHHQDAMQFDDEARNADHRYSMGFVDEECVASLRRTISGEATNTEIETTIGRIVGKFIAGGHVKAQPRTTQWRSLARERLS